MLPEFFRHWTCNRQVGIDVDPRDADMYAAVASATAKWNAVLHRDRLHAAPELFPDTLTSPDILAHRVGSASSAAIWCGTEDGASPPATFTLWTTCVNHPDLFTPVMTHELAHVLGFADANFEKETTPLDCVIRIQGPDHVNSTPCAQEVEYIFAAYGLASIDPNTIWSQPVVTGPRVLVRSVTVQATKSVADSVASIVVDYPDVEPTTDSPARGVYFWSPDNQTVAQIDSASGTGATIRGLAAGTTYVRVVMTSTLVPNAVLGTAARLIGDSVKVVVTDAPPPPPPPPPPGSGFRVTSITGAPTPITISKSYQLTATVTGYSGAPSIRWQVTYSNGVLGPFDTGYQGPNYTLSVPSGSYRITVTASPYAQGVYGTALVQYFPVCTGGEQLSAGKTADGQQSPDVVGGC